MMKTERARKGSAAERPISFLIPVYNERESLPQLVEQIRERCGRPYEIVFVDDGSSDGSYQVLEELHAREPDRIRVIRFRRNFGKSHALSAGFRAVQGELVFTMDADLQDDPAEIPAFLEKLETEELDMVSGWKRRRHDPWHKTLPSKLFNAVIARISGLPLHDFNCGYKLYRAEALAELDLYGEMHRFIPAFVHARGFRVGEMVVQHHARRFGQSKFGWRRLYRGLFDAITVTLLTRYTRRPLHFFGGAGLLLGLAGAGILAYFVIEKLMGYDIGYRPLFFGGILAVIAGLQTFAIGLVSELLVNQSARREDLYSIRNVLEREPDGANRRKQAGAAASGRAPRKSRSAARKSN